ncbi:MAG: hypothetical protein M1826_007600 [Phylliscum demangeonii]|nr:MAG: hypothetical protein M1826_007600 [Phylliscum demangeonii]
MRYPWTLALLMVAFLAISISAANQHDVRLVCSVGYKPCKPYAFDVGPLLEPIEGSAIAKMYVDSIRSLGGQSRSISQVQQFVNVLGYEDQAEPVCCTQSSLCAIVTQLDVPYCYDRRTSDFFFPDGSYGSVSVGNVTISNGNGGNLATGETSSAFYLPGVAPTSYQTGDRVPLYVNHLTPGISNQDAQLHSVFSYDYYLSVFGFCRPEDGPQRISESLGSILFGDRILTSPYELYMLKNESCKAVCAAKTIDADAAKFINRRITQNYNVNWLIDGLPAGQLIGDSVTHEEFYSPGFFLGSRENGKARVNNHVDILIDYHEISGKKARVVGVLARPSSRRESKRLEDGGAECGAETEPLELSETSDSLVTWTYSVSWQPSRTVWATRWDKYLHVFDARIHWFPLINAAVIVLVLTAMVSTILLRALRKDIARYNRLDRINLDDLSGTSAALDDGVQEDSGWKLVHGDVFRAPAYPLILSVLLGTGAQLFVMTGLTIFFALLGFLSPSNRGSIGTVAILLYTFLGAIGGYVSARVYKAFGGERWTLNIALTPLLIPGVVFGTFFLLNLFLWAKQASGAVPFSTMLIMISIWFGISVPLSAAGWWAGIRQPAVSSPVRTNQIPRQIPPSAAMLRPVPSMPLVGLLPFGAIFIELYFIMSSIWFHKVYYMFGFLFVCYGLMTVTCAAVTILTVYFLLCAENYHWHWRAFFTAGASAMYVFLYAILYWITKVSLGGFAGNVLYLGYSALVSLLFFVLMGSIGFFSTWVFVRRIYGSIKID